ncbi:hypothetical protein L208DRAFT_99103 [Tricholoma matsutake]|nr:hypothetical protein L208DRAFT_99103 [Tricholoma matsutake 945]
MHEWLLDLYDWFAERRRGGSGKVDGRMDPSVLPGWAYARALALRMGEDARKGQEHDESTKALKEAIAGFPPVVPLLADKLDLSISVSIRGHRDFRIETDASSLSAPDAALHLLSHLYVQRSFGIWKDPTYSSWFLQTLAALYPSSLPSSLPKTAQHTTFITLFTHSNPQASAHRHILVLEATCRRLFAFVPRTTLGGLTASSSLACDPLPPATAVSKYDEAFFEGVEDAFTEGARTRREQALDERRLAQLIPDANYQGIWVRKC